MSLQTRADYPDQRCFYCGVLGPVTKDHYIPASKGGKGLANLVLCCTSCNRTKGDRDGTEFIAWLVTPEGRVFFHQRRFHAEIVDNACPHCVSKRNAMRRKWLDWYERKYGLDRIDPAAAAIA